MRFDVNARVAIWRVAIASVTAASLSACDASDRGPMAAPSAFTPSTLREGPSRLKPLMKRTALLYVSDSYRGTVFVYAYPSLTPAGTLPGFQRPAGLCVDRRNGNVWVTDMFKHNAVEFAHGSTTPIRTLDDGAGYLNACAVNPTNGDVALVNNTIQGEDPGDVVVYHPEERGRAPFPRHMCFSWTLPATILVETYLSTPLGRRTVAFSASVSRSLRMAQTA